jgi:hypothetical protein
MSTNGTEVTGTAIVAIRRSAGLNPEKWPDERIETVRRMYAPQAKSVHELSMFLATAERYDLDPVLGEVWLAPMNGALKVVTGRDAMLKAARRTPGFTGIVSGVVYEKDSFKLLRSGDDVKVTHEINGFDRGPMMGAYCVAYHAERTPVVIVRKWTDYKHLHSKAVWKDYGEDMIETRCITAALRRQYQLSGLYEESEFRDEGTRLSTAATSDLNAMLEDEAVVTVSESETREADWEMVSEGVEAELPLG